MAYIVNSKQTPAASSGTTYTAQLGAHVSGDLLVAYISSGSGTTPISLLNSAVTASAASDTLTYSGNDHWTDGDQITISGTAPGGLTAETVRYFIRDLNTGAKTFKLAATAGGSAIDLTSAGSSVVANLMTAGANHPLNGWAILGGQVSGLSARSTFAYKIAASASETAPTFYGTSAEWLGTVFVVRDSHATAPFGTTPTSGTDFVRTTVSSVTSQASGSLTTAADESLILYGWTTGGGGRYIKCKTQELTGIDLHRTTSTAHVVGMRQQQAAGAAPSATAYFSLSSSGNAMMVAIRNKSGGVLQPDIRPTITELKWYGSFNSTYDGSTTWQSPANLTAKTAGGFTVGLKYTIISVGTTDFTLIGAASNTVGLVFTATGAGSGTGTAGEEILGIPVSNTLATVDNAPTSAATPWGAHTGLQSSESTTGAWTGGTHAISSADMAGKVFGLQLAMTSSASLFSPDAIIGAYGLVVVFSDGTNWAAYTLRSSGRGWSANEFWGAFVALGAATLLASSGSINWAAVTRIGYFMHRQGSSASARQLYVKNATLFDNVKITGGGAGRPATFVDYANLMGGWGTYKWADLQGSAQVLGKSSVGIGDGTNATYFDSSASSFEYPKTWSATPVANWNADWNANAGAVGLTVEASAADTINLSAGVVATSTEEGFTVDPASSTGATYSFAGTSMVGFAPAWKTGVPCAAMTFSGCYQIDAKAAAFTGSRIIASKETTSAMKVANGAAIAACAFIKGAESYALLIETAGDYDLSETTFAGYATDLNITATSGTVTITLAAGQSEPSYTSAGATVVFDQPQAALTIAAQVSLAGAEIRIYDLDNNPAGSLGTELSGTESCPTATYEYLGVAGNTVLIQAMLAGYVEISQSIVIPASAFTLTLALQPDINA